MILCAANCPMPLGWSFSVNNRSKETLDDILAEVNGCPVFEIKDEGFEHCYNLVSITLPDSIKRIGDNAFYNCFNLESITIGVGVESIGDNVFKSCSNLVFVRYNGTITQWNAITKGIDWGKGVQATEVICLDGMAEIS